ncbi:MAG: hypothetical protein J6D14_00005, partial [Lachnospiraceae bacterium]|nr:hypothetical protein [Lachnospiraceae bacterium]
VVVNSSTERIIAEIPVWETGVPRNRNTIMRELLRTNEQGYASKLTAHDVTAGILTIELSAHEAVVLKA